MFRAAFTRCRSRYRKESYGKCVREASLFFTNLDVLGHDMRRGDRGILHSDTAPAILECGGKRSATPLWIRMDLACLRG